ncbi:MAG: FAD-binding oxidoreductase [Myxococcales bacterium]|nr:MAG: FAD-binding oxidoreductase [Myxococcales bacterium]
MWPPTVMWTKEGRFPHLPDAVASPRTAEEVAQLLVWAARERIPVVPYGAGSGVCAGAMPIKGGLVLSLKRMDALVGVDAESLVAEVETGIYGEILERRLAPLGCTMGHFPSSIYCSTLGGYLAARSAGQMSSRYGKIEDMAVGIEFVLPDGGIHRTLPCPIGMARPDWAQVLIGSEGALGVITRAWMRVHPLPQHRVFHSFHFPGVGLGLEAMRKIMQAGVAPAVLRLYDEFDSLVAGSHGASKDAAARFDDAPGGWEARLAETFETLKKKSLAAILPRAGWLNRAAGLLPGKCLLVLVTEGEPDLAEHEARRAAALCRQASGESRGEGPARYWLEHRYAVSYKQSKIFDAGGWVDTMEVASPWRALEPMYNAVRAAVADDVFIMAHFSHAWPDGCCIYFSFAGMAENAAQMEVRHARVWRKALDAVHRLGGTITHHHGVGLSKGPMLVTEYGGLWPLWKQVKAALDPDGVMNPGKLGLAP